MSKGYVFLTSYSDCRHGAAVGRDEIQRDIHLAYKETKAYFDVLESARKIGWVLYSDFISGSVTVRTRVGLWAVDLRIAVTPDGDGARVSVRAFGEDSRGSRARKAIDKLVVALRDYPAPNH